MAGGTNEDQAAPKPPFAAVSLWPITAWLLLRRAPFHFEEPVPESRVGGTASASFAQATHCA